MFQPCHSSLYPFHPRHSSLYAFVLCIIVVTARFMPSFYVSFSSQPALCLHFMHHPRHSLLYAFVLCITPVIARFAYWPLLTLVFHVHLSVCEWSLRNVWLLVRSISMMQCTAALFIYTGNMFWNESGEVWLLAWFSGFCYSSLWSYLFISVLNPTFPA